MQRLHLFPDEVSRSLVMMLFLSLQLNTFSSFKIIAVLIFNNFMPTSEIFSVFHSELTIITVVLVLNYKVSYHWTKD